MFTQSLLVDEITRGVQTVFWYMGGLLVLDLIRNTAECCVYVSISYTPSTLCYSGAGSTASRSFELGVNLIRMHGGKVRTSLVFGS